MQIPGRPAPATPVAEARMLARALDEETVFKPPCERAAPIMELRYLRYFLVILSWPWRKNSVSLAQPKAARSSFWMRRSRLGYREQISFPFSGNLRPIQCDPVFSPNTLLILLADSLVFRMRRRDA
jgi:hypothetical protein